MQVSQRIPNENVKLRFAREFMNPLSYARREDFQTTIKRAIGSCKTTGGEPYNHFLGVTKVHRLDSGTE